MQSFDVWAQSAVLIKCVAVPQLNVHVNAPVCTLSGHKQDAERSFHFSFWLALNRRVPIDVLLPSAREASQTLGRVERRWCVERGQWTSSTASQQPPKSKMSPGGPGAAEQPLMHGPPKSGPARRSVNETNAPENVNDLAAALSLLSAAPRLMAKLGFIWGGAILWKCQRACDGAGASQRDGTPLFPGRSPRRPDLAGADVPTIDVARVGLAHRDLVAVTVARSAASEQPDL
ncbi:unnamed protein product [Lota lota]